MSRRLKSYSYIPIQVRVDKNIKIDFKAILKRIKEQNTYKGPITKELVISVSDVTLINIIKGIYKELPNPTMGKLTFCNKVARDFIEWLLNL